MSARLQCLETVNAHSRYIRERLDVEDIDVVPELTPIIPFTYSSVLTDGRVVPSRLSAMSAHAAEFLRNVLVADVSPPKFDYPIIVAGETSHPAHADTGTLLAEQVFTEATPVTIVSEPSSTALLNTSGQVRALAQHIRDNIFTDPFIVSLACHQQRIVRHFEAQDMQVVPISIENIFAWAQHFMKKDELEQLANMYGLQYDPLSTLCHVIKKYARREKYTRLAALPFDGIVVDALTAIKQRGRQDDIDEKGRLVMGNASVHSVPRLDIFRNLRHSQEQSSSLVNS